jgi:hypothetical protein
MSSTANLFIARAPLGRFRRLVVHFLAASARHQFESLQPLLREAYQIAVRPPDRERRRRGQEGKHAGDA